MSISFKKNLFLMSIMTFAAFLLPGNILAMQEEEKEDMDLNKNPSKENIKKEENNLKPNDFLSRIKSLPKESLEKKKDAKLCTRSVVKKSLFLER